MKDRLYVIRGTGFPIDGLVVSIGVSGVDGYVSVHPVGKKSSTYADTSVVIHPKYLQLLSEDIELVDYEIKITKTRKDGVIEDGTVCISNCYRNVSTGSISEFLKENLSPFLKG